MKFVTVPTQEWWGHDNCANAYRVHRYDCPLMEDDFNKPQDRAYYEHPSVGKDSVEGAMTDAFFDAHERFPYTLRIHGFEPLISLCECCGGRNAKTRILQEADWAPLSQWFSE